MTTSHDRPTGQEVPLEFTQTALARDGELLQAVAYEIKKEIVGQEHAVERILVCLLAGGHCLVEGLPGLAKTLLVKTLAHVVDSKFVRIQFTPDLVPSDIVGTRVYRASSERFDVELGPIFANFVLADEINRAPAKVHAALLEVMAENHVSIGGQTYPVPKPFLVLATQNPIESEGVYPLPEAQRDRFLMKLLIPYPSYSEELEIVHRMSEGKPKVHPVITSHQLLELQRHAAHVFVEPAVADYAVRLVIATREPERFGLEDVGRFLACGVSPRASLGLIASARALALMWGRSYAISKDVAEVAPEVLRHRLVLSYEAMAEDVSANDVVEAVLKRVPAPSQGADIHPRRTRSY
ncbi:MAG: AAA family ATPase [Acidimicrobiales bacterium]